MKIRIKGNSIRIRLSKSEVALFANDGCVEERTDFGDGALVYAVKSTRDEAMSATFAGGIITMFVPEDLLQQWFSSKLVSLQHRMPVAENKYLHILLEKDFKCIDADITEDQSDYFENPLKSC